MRYLSHPAVQPDRLAMPEFICMLTHADRTVADAVAVYRSLRATRVRYVGFKDMGASSETLRCLTDEIHADGRHAVLEIVSETTDDELRSVDIGLALGVDLLMGGRRPDLVLPRIGATGPRYLPFCGTTSGHPTILSGTPQEIGEDARRLTETPGIGGLDLLAYRHAGDPSAVMAAVVRQAKLPVVIAGNIDREERIAAVAASGAWGFTVGSAIFAGAFVAGASHQTQVDHILRMAERSIELAGPS